MAELDADHWWYVGLRDALASVLRAAGAERSDVRRVLDAGCGTGATLEWLAEEFQPDYLAGFDSSPLALSLSKQRCPAADVYAGDVCQPVLHRPEFDLIVCCDVISVPGVERARAGLARLVSALRPGGWLLLHGPAYQWLMSDHDRWVGNSERSKLADNVELLQSLGLESLVASYRVSMLFPAIASYRMLRGFCTRASGREPASNLRRRSNWLNRALKRLVRFENGAIESGFRWPFGTSVIALGQKSAGSCQ
ncbi:MAG: class I SAM-dependent methyltransferase [Planctomycetes bacterium]|nr:class I SAM-dependent methyltransferase [Planctomycetota bacterium]